MNSQQRRKARRMAEIFVSANIVFAVRLPPDYFLRWKVPVGSYIKKIRNPALRKAVKAWLRKSKEHSPSESRG